MSWRRRLVLGRHDPRVGVREEKRLNADEIARVRHAATCDCRSGTSVGQDARAVGRRRQRDRNGGNGKPGSGRNRRVEEGQVADRVLQTESRDRPVLEHVAVSGGAQHVVTVPGVAGFSVVERRDSRSGRPGRRRRTMWFRRCSSGTDPRSGRERFEEAHRPRRGSKRWPPVFHSFRQRLPHGVVTQGQFDEAGEW